MAIILFSDPVTGRWLKEQIMFVFWYGISLTGSCKAELPEWS